MRPDHLAKEADRLKNDEVLNNALDDMREAALDELAVADADDKTAIIRLQQKVAVIDEFHSVLDRYIVAVEADEDAKGSFA